MNTRNRRASALAMLEMDTIAPSPDGLLDTSADRLQLAGLYAGIEPSPPLVSDSPTPIATYGGYTVGFDDTTLTFSATITDAAQKLIVFAWTREKTVTGVTFHGDALSLIDQQNKDYVWVLGAPDVGTFDVVVTINTAWALGAVAWVVENWDGDFREFPGSLSDNGKMIQLFSGSSHPTLTFPSGVNDLTLHWIREFYGSFDAYTYSADFGQALGLNLSPAPLATFPGETTSKAGDTSVTVGFTHNSAFSSMFLSAVSLMAPDAPPEPEVPYVGINPQQGDPVGDLHFIRVKIGVNSYFASEAMIRDAALPWEGKKAAELLKIGTFERTLSREGYQATTCSFTVSDTPNAAGLRRWRDLIPTLTVEGSLIELYRCSAPNGTIVGTPFRLWAGVVKPGGFKASSGFKFEFSCVDLLGDRFANPLNQPNIPTFRLTAEDIPNLFSQSSGKYVPRVLGQAIESGVGVVPMLPLVEDVNLFDLLGGLALNVNVDVWLLSEGAVYDIPRGYYNPASWGADVDVLAGDLIRPTPENRNGHVFRAENDGTTGGTEPTWPTSGTVGDNGITWHEDGADDPRTRYPIPDEAYSNFMTHPYAPNWTAATGLSTQYVDYPFASGTRRLTPVFTLHEHRYGQALRDGRITLLFNVIGARQLPSSGPPLLKFTDVYIRLLLDYLFTPTDLTTYGDIPIYNALDGPYSVIDVDSAAAAEVIGDALGGLTAGFSLGSSGQPESMWGRLSAMLRGGSLEIGPNRHGQLMFSRRDVDAQPTITFRAHKIIESSYHADGTKRATNIELRFGPRYADPFASTEAASPGDPTPTSKNVIDWGWASGLQQLPPVGDPNPAYEALWNTHAALLPPLKLDNDVTFDAETAFSVAQRELDYATGPGPSYHGTILFELTGPIDDLIMRLDSNNRTRENGDVIGIQDDQGPTGDGEETTHRGRIIRTRMDVEADRATLIGEILPDS
jgi:hypothetical protein